MPISEVFNEDNMIGMARYPDKYFELAICDPPYGIRGEEGNSHWIRKRFTDKGKNWDSSIPDRLYFSELTRVSQNQIIWGGNYFVEYLPPSMGWVCWFKTMECVGRQFSEFELAFTSFQRAARIVELKPFQRNGSRIHPTQKPVALYKWLLDKYAQPDNKILDTHMGSQSSRIAAYQMGFDYWGFEIDESYYKEGCKRFDELTKQQSLFPYGH